jgi:hypothetical protein
MTVAGHAQKAPEATIRAGLTGDEQQKNHDSKSGLIEEDCFCCCQHVQPSYGLITPATNCDNSVFHLPSAGLPTPPPISTYRPPRSASC